MKSIKTPLFYGLIITCLLVLFGFLSNEFSSKIIPIPDSDIEVASNLSNDNLLAKLSQTAEDIKAFAEKKKYNQKVCILIDMSIPSGKQRCFLYDLSKDTIISSGLVAHGQGLSSTSVKVQFSNEVGSYCTSLGKYSIGKPYQGKFGLAYKLYGLESSNSNAFNRFVVLHAHECVPNEEIYPDPICESQGCPTLSPGFLQVVAKYIDASSKSIILEIIQ